MDCILSRLGDFTLPYLDDIAIFSDAWNDHIRHLRGVLERLPDTGLTVQAEKCQIGTVEVSYLGHVIGQGYRHSADVRTAVTGYARPPTKTEKRAFLGLANYYHQYYIRG